MTNNLPTRFSPTPLRVATVTLSLMLGGCTINNPGEFFSSRADYKSSASRTPPLVVPPDLTQLQGDSRYLPQGGVVNASDVAKRDSATTPDAAPTNGSGTPSVALDSAGGVHLEHQGNSHWLSTREAPETVWPKVRDFWLSRGFTLASEEPKVGVMETDWAMANNRIPTSLVQDLIGKIFDETTDAGVRNRYRTRLERQPDGSTEIFVSEFGAAQERTGPEKETLEWTPRPNDPGLEAQMLSEMMLSLSGASETAVAAAAPASAASAPARVIPSSSIGSDTVGSGPNGAMRARLVTGQPGATLQVDDNFDRAWRRVGLALDHGGFTVEDRDRAQGIYYVRYTNAAEAAKDDSGGMMAKIGGWFGHTPPSPVGKYRISIKAPADTATVTVLNDQGLPDNSDNARHIVSLLVDELK